MMTKVDPRAIRVNPLSPYDALNHNFKYPGTDMKISTKLVYQYMVILFIFHQFQTTSIYKSRTAKEIRGLQWMKMTMVNSGLKELKN